MESSIEKYNRLYTIVSQENAKISNVLSEHSEKSKDFEKLESENAFGSLNETIKDMEKMTNMCIEMLCLKDKIKEQAQISGDITNICKKYLDHKKNLYDIVNDDQLDTEKKLQELSNLNTDFRDSMSNFTLMSLNDSHRLGKSNDVFDKVNSTMSIAIHRYVKLFQDVDNIINENNNKDTMLARINDLLADINKNIDV